jgi:hypothetical protein
MACNVGKQRYDNLPAANYACCQLGKLGKLGKVGKLGKLGKLGKAANYACCQLGKVCLFAASPDVLQQSLCCQKDLTFKCDHLHCCNASCLQQMQQKSIHCFAGDGCFCSR